MKTVLVIDVPTESLDNVIASAVICEQREGYNIILKRMVKMSLKPLPEEKHGDDLYCFDSDYDFGWNDCLKEIIGETDTTETETDTEILQ